MAEEKDTRQPNPKAVDLHPPCSAIVRMVVELRYDAGDMHGADAESKRWFQDLLLNKPLALFSEEMGDFVGEVKVIKVTHSDHLPKCIICCDEEPCSHDFSEPNATLSHEEGGKEQRRVIQKNTIADLLITHDIIHALSIEDAEGYDNFETSDNVMRFTLALESLLFPNDEVCHQGREKKL